MRSHAEMLAMFDQGPSTWFVLQVEARCEVGVVTALRDMGVAAWTPMARRWAKAGAPAAVTSAAFPSYVLVALAVPNAENFSAALSVRGARGFLGGEQPIPVSALAVALLQARETCGHFDATRSRPPKMIRGRGLDPKAADELTGLLGRGRVMA